MKFVVQKEDVYLVLEVPISSPRVAVSELDIWVTASEETKEEGSKY